MHERLRLGSRRRRGARLALAGTLACGATNELRTLQASFARLQPSWRRRRWLRTLVDYEVPAWFWEPGVAAAEGQRRVAFAGEDRVFVVDGGEELSAQERFARRMHYRDATRRAMDEVRAEQGEQSADRPESVCLAEETVSRTGGHSSTATQQSATPTASIPRGAPISSAARSPTRPTFKLRGGRLPDAHVPREHRMGRAAGGQSWSCTTSGCRAAR